MKKPPSTKLNFVKAIAREQAYEESMRDISGRLKEDEERASNAERAVAKLTKDMDRLEGKLNKTNIFFAFAFP